MYFVERGRIASRVRSGSGQVLDVGFAGPGELFGYFEAFDGGPRDSDAVALETSVLVRVPHPVGRRLLSSGTEPLIGVVDDLLRIVRIQNRDAIERHAHPVSMRLAALLLHLADGTGRVVLDGAQTLLAHRIGTTRQSLSRSLHRMAADGLIRVDDGGRRIAILDRDRLRAQSQPTA
jgi:CRP-like cAMP-binding protein